MKRVTRLGKVNKQIELTFQHLDWKPRVEYYKFLNSFQIFSFLLMIKEHSKDFSQLMVQLRNQPLIFL